MFQKAIFIFLFFPVVCFGENFTKESLVGEWTLLGNSREITEDYSTLMLFTPGDIVYSADGKYEYFREDEAVINGEWSYQETVLSIKRKDGVFHNKIHSFKNGLLITYEELFGQKMYMYLKKK